MRIAILGGPGSGKGTQARILSERYRVPHISAGDLLREAIKNDKKFGNEAKAAMDAGRLVDDEIVLKLLDERLRKKDTKRGFIIDGYPRNIPQAQSLDALLGLLGRALQISVNMDVDDDIMIKRVSGRVMCSDCGAIFNKHFNPTKKRGICDECEGKSFETRDDASQKSAETQVQIYREFTFPLIAYYKAQHKLRTVRGVGEIEEIQQKFCDIIDLEIRPLEVKSVETASETYDEVDTTIIAGGQINTVDVVVKKRPRKKKKVVAKVATAKASKSKKKPVTKETKKATSKKTSGKKAAVKTKKPAVKKKTPVVSNKKVAKKKAAKKKVIKKPAAKKVAAKKVAAKKSATKKPVAKKKTAKKVTKKKTVAKKTPTKKKVSKKATTKKKVAKKKVAKKKVATKR